MASTAQAQLFKLTKTGSFSSISSFLQQQKNGKSGPDGKNSNAEKRLVLLLNSQLEGITALHAAVKYKRTEIVALLLENGANVDGKDWESKTALHHALQPPCQDIRVACELLRCGASIDVRDKNGMTPLDLLSHRMLMEYIASSHDSNMGQCFAWGAGNNYQLGQTAACLSKKKASKVEELPTGVRSVCTSKLHSVVVGCQGEVWTSGFGTGGRLGHGEEKSLALFQRISSLEKVRVSLVAVSDNHTIAIADRGAVFAWGSNKFGQLGIGQQAAGPNEEEVSLTPKRLTELRKQCIIAAAAAATHTVLVQDNGSLWTCGSNSQGQLGHTLLDVAVWLPKKVESLADKEVCACSATEAYTAIACTAEGGGVGSLFVMGQGRAGLSRVVIPKYLAHLQWGTSISMLQAQADRLWALANGVLLVVEHQSCAGGGVSFGSRALVPKCTRKLSFKCIAAPPKRGRVLAISVTGQVLEIFPNDAAGPPSSSAGSGGGLSLLSSSPGMQESSSSPASSRIACPSTPDASLGLACSSSPKSGGFFASPTLARSSLDESCSPSCSPDSGHASPSDSWKLSCRKGVVLDESDALTNRYLVKSVDGIRRATDVAAGAHHALAVLGTSLPPSAPPSRSSSDGGVPSLQYLCERAAESMVDLRNVASCASFTESFPVPALRKYTIEFLFRNLDTVLATGVWRELSDKTLADLQRRIGSDSKTQPRPPRDCQDSDGEGREGGEVVEEESLYSQGDDPYEELVEDEQFHLELEDAASEHDVSRSHSQSVRKLRKKLQQIWQLEVAQGAGKVLNEDQSAKLSSKVEILSRLRSMGEDPDVLFEQIQKNSTPSKSPQALLKDGDDSLQKLELDEQLAGTEQGDSYGSTREIEEKETGHQAKEEEEEEAPGKSKQSEDAGVYGYIKSDLDLFEAFKIDKVSSKKSKQSKKKEAAAPVAIGSPSQSHGGSKKAWKVTEGFEAQSLRDLFDKEKVKVEDNKPSLKELFEQEQQKAETGRSRVTGRPGGGGGGGGGGWAKVTPPKAEQERCMDQAFPSISSAKPIREERKRAEEAEDELFWGPSDSSKSLSSKSPAGWSPQGEGRGPASLPPPSPTHTFSAAKSWAKSSPASGFSLADFAVAKTPKGRKKVNAIVKEVPETRQDVAASPSPKDASKGWSFVSHSPSPPLTGSEVVSLASIQAEEEKARNPKQSRRKQVATLTLLAAGDL